MWTKESDYCFLASCFGASKLKGISSIYTLHVWVNRVGGRPCRGAPQCSHSDFLNEVFPADFNALLMN